MRIMGIYPGGHDPAVCLLRDGQVQVMIEDERLTRVKHGVYGPLTSLWSKHNQRFGFFPWASVSYCLRATGLSLDDLDAIVVPHWGRQDCQIVPPLGEGPDGGFDWAEFLPIAHDRIIVADEPWGGSHHLMHGMSAFYASPFEQAAVLVVDAAGSLTAEGAEAETGYVFEDRQGRWREVFKNRYPTISMPTTGDDSSSLRRQVETSIGYMYEQASGVLGFVNTAARVADAGKTMGLAPYGGPTPELAEPWVTSDGFTLDFSNLYRYAFSSGLYERYSFADRSKALIQNENDISPLARNLAWKVQAELEKAVLHLASELQRVTGADNLCLSGGVALNSVANGRLLRNGVFKNIFVQPAAADSGQALGLAYYGHLKLGSKAPIKAIRNAFGGRSHERGEIAALLEGGSLTVTELPNDDALCDDAAHELAKGRIVGWFQGGSEYGPRSLGHRSILADPRPPDMKDHLNGRVKFRESFRPFAPSVLQERCHEVFELEQESPYMLFVAPVRPDWKQRIPAVTHVDGTARIQTVTRDSDPLFHQLISSFSSKTEVPLLLNTSYNLRGMPIVETPHDALQCFLLTDMDALYLGRFKVQAPTLAQMLIRVSRPWHIEASANPAFQDDPSVPAPSFVSVTADGDARRVDIGPMKLLAAFSHALVGDRSARDVLVTALKGAPATPEIERATLEFVRRMLRAGVFSIRVGQHWMTA